MTAGFVIAGTASGVGKTTIATGIAAALRARGLRVQPFKAGPDYIDPTYLSRAAERPCRNLDTWMLSASVVRELFARASAAADVVVVEGVMGLFDGRSGEDEAGSTAQLAKLLGLPVVLVVDASAMARSAAATVLGYQRFDPDLRIAGVILNRVGSEAHAAMCAGPIERTTGLPVLGALPRSAEITLPERHLGLVPDVEAPAAVAFFAQLAQLAERYVDLDALLMRAGACDLAAEHVVFPSSAQPAITRIAVARDAAFNFYYEDSLDLLSAWGAELAPFSPLEDAALPAGVDAIYIGGGFPELFAAELASNAPMHEALRRAARDGVPVYAECGGLMYLGTALTDFEGRQHELVGLVPAHSVMTRDRLTLGYREVASRGTPILPTGEQVRAHEFHWSTLPVAPTSEQAAYTILDGGARPEGYRVGSVVATYVHTHLGARPDLARNFVLSAQAARNRMGTEGSAND